MLFKLSYLKFKFRTNPGLSLSCFEQPGPDLLNFPVIENCFDPYEVIIIIIIIIIIISCSFFGYPICSCVA